jgi:nucleoid-associated protein YgaU
MAAPLIVPLILLGGATIALAAASASKKRKSETPPAAPPGGKTYTLDAGMPAAIRDQVLAALTMENDPAKLEAFAGAIASQFPLSASALRTKAAMMRSLQGPPIAPPPIAPIPQIPTIPDLPPIPKPQAPAAPAAPNLPADLAAQLLGIPDPPRSEIARQLMAQTDPNQLEAFARQVEPQFPIAAMALRARAALLRGVPVAPSPTPAPIPPPAPQPGGVLPPLPIPPLVIPPAPQPAPPQPPGVPAPVIPPLGGLDPGMPPEMQKAVLGALTTEGDPAKLEGFASAIQAQFPIAAGLLMAKAQALRLVRPPGVAPPGPAPVPPSPLPPVVPPIIPPIAPPVVPPAPVATSGTYTVKDGDFPIKIAQKLTGDGNRWRELIAANPEKKTRPDGAFATLFPGEVLKLPASWAKPGPAPAPLPLPPPPIPIPPISPGVLPPGGLPGVLPAILPIPVAAPATYVVQNGDFPIKIAVKFTNDGSRWHELIAANPQKKTRPDGAFVSLTPGEILKLPASWVPAQPALPAIPGLPALPGLPSIPGLPGGTNAAHA